MQADIAHPQRLAHDDCIAPAASNLCAVIVTYFPDALFKDRLDQIRSQVCKTIVVDNTGKASASTVLQGQDGDDLEIIVNRENLGIAGALNQGVSRAIELGYSWAITFDQDTWVHGDLVKTLIGIYLQQMEPETVGIIGCNFEDENIGRCPNESRTEKGTFFETETVITSGSMMAASVFRIAGPFRSDFFIDFVDNEYCLRLRRLGYRILTSTAPLMRHALGAATTDFRVGSMTLRRSNRSALRRYYMTRNALLVARDYISVAPTWVLKSLVGVLVLAVLKIPLERDSRWKKFRATFYGLFDAIRSRTGEAEASWLRD